MVLIAECDQHLTVYFSSTLSYAMNITAQIPSPWKQIFSEQAMLRLSFHKPILNVIEPSTTRARIDNAELRFPTIAPWAVMFASVLCDWLMKPVRTAACLGECGGTSDFEPVGKGSKML